jgi:hypothetical protein
MTSCYETHMAANGHWLMRTEMKTGDMVCVTVPWPSGPKSDIAKITRIGDDSVQMSVNLGDGWKIAITAPRHQIVTSLWTDMLHLEQDRQV